MVGDAGAGGADERAHPPSDFSLEEYGGVAPSGAVHWNLSPAELVEHALRRGEGRLTDHGALATVTAPHTGRSPDDKFTVREETTGDEIWWGEVNVALDEDHWRVLHRDVLEHLATGDLYVRDARAGADPEYGLNVRIITNTAWHSLFAYNMFVRLSAAETRSVEPEFVVLHAPDMKADPERHGTRSGAFVVVNLEERTIVIGGTKYAGEIKKSVFSVLNYLLPRRGVLSMHCSANVGDGGDVALFFGLSGTGKTTLSTVPDRGLIGDDEHGWSDRGVFNFEGGSYAKVIRLSAEGEPEIYQATQRFGTIVENVVLDDDTRAIAFEDDAITENTRSSYPIHYIPMAVKGGQSGHPRNAIFLTADAFGVIPPISKLTPAQAMYHFLSGYTAKVAGTERGVDEPRATFSACFGAPFLPLPPAVYAHLLGEKIRERDVACWLVNTGWTGGPYGTGHRIELAYTRAMVRAALKGHLDESETRREPVFGFAVPMAVPHVPDQVLRPRETWDDPEAYDAQAEELTGMFRENFRRFADEVKDEVREAGPA